MGLTGHAISTLPKLYYLKADCATHSDIVEWKTTKNSAAAFIDAEKVLTYATA